MNQASATMIKKIQILVRHSKKNQPEQAHDIQPHLGDQGKTLIIVAEADTRYELRDLVTQRGACWFIFKTEPLTPSFTTKFEPRSTYPANFLGRVCRSDQRGNT